MRDRGRIEGGGDGQTTKGGRQQPGAVFTSYLAELEHTTHDLHSI